MTAVRARGLQLAAVAALVAPTALAFASGGYFAQARLVALLVAWALVLVALALGAPLPARRPAWVALGALAALTVWVAVAGGWSPLAATARGDLERDVLYLGALTAAVLLLGGARRLVEPVLAAGALVVVGYGLAGRLAPGIVTLSQTASAGGRLDQPLTYWNAMGALAALGLVLALRLGGEPSRPRALRAAAAAGAVPLCTGLILAFSRGALVAGAVGVVLVVLLAPTAAQVRAVACGLVPGALAAFAATRADGVRALQGDLAARERQGLAVLAALLALMALAAGLAWVAAGRPQRSWPAVPARRLAVAAIVVALVAVPVAIGIAGSGGGDRAGFGATASRLGSAASNRADYWRVAWDAAGERPLRGLGPGGFGPAWLRARTYDEAVKDAHSLPLETLAELGLVGLALLLALLGAVAVAARDALRADAALAAGPAAVAATWLVHACVDWDWEMPALTLVAVACAGALLSGPAVRAPSD
jgi:hypothetical protein